MNAADLVRLSALGVATVYEAAGREGLIDIPLIQLLPGIRVAGPARTVLCGQDDNLMVHAVIEHIQPGEVLVLTMPEPAPVALLGELLATQVKVRSARVRGATKSVAGELNQPVWVGGTCISPADILLMDADGAVCVRRELAVKVLQAAEARFEREAQLRTRLLAGEISYDLHGLRKLVERDEE